jgi:hypothetical protein
MGASMTKLSNTNLKACTADADCYAADTATSPDLVLLSTDAEKAKACCMAFGMLTLSSGTTAQIAIGDAVIAAFKT